jgi:hypothetical protein
MRLVATNLLPRAAGGPRAPAGGEKKRRKLKQTEKKKSHLSLKTKAPYVCIDLEVTGASRALHEVCEIGVAAFRVTHANKGAKDVGIDVDMAKSWLVKPGDRNVKWDEGL